MRLCVLSNKNSDFQTIASAFILAFYEIDLAVGDYITCYVWSKQWRAHFAKPAHQLFYCCVWYVFYFPVDVFSLAEDSN